MATLEEIQAQIAALPTVIRPSVAQLNDQVESLPTVEQYDNEQTQGADEISALDTTTPWSQRPENIEQAKRWAEQEALVEQWDLPFVLSTGGASFALRRGLPLLGRTVHSLITPTTAFIGEFGIVKPLSIQAGRLHPWLEPIVGIAGGIGSAVTLEALLSKFMIKALTKSAPKFWSNQLGAMKTQTSIPEQFFDERAHLLARRADNGDVQAAQELLIQMNRVAYDDMASKASKKAAKVMANIAAKKVSGETSEQLITELKPKAIKRGLKSIELERILKVAQRDAIHEYATDFDKIRKSIITERAAAEWAEHPLKNSIDHILASGGLNESMVRRALADSTDEVVDKIIDQIKKKFPKLLVKKDGVSLTKVARDLEQPGVKKLIADIADAPGLRKITTQKQIEFRGEFDRVFRDEIFIRAQEKTAKYLGKVLGVKEIKLPPPGAPRKGFTVVGETIKELEQGKSLGRVVNEMVALRGTIKRMSAIIQRETKKAVTKEAKAKLERVRRAYASQLADYKARTKIRSDTERIKSRLKSTYTRKPMIPEYKEQIQNFLAPMFGGGKIELQETLFQFLTRKYNDDLAFGADVLIKKYNTMLQALQTRPSKFSELTFSQIKDIDDFVKAFNHVASNEKTIIAKGQKLFLNAVAGNIESTALTTMPRFRSLRPDKILPQLEEEAAKAKMGKFQRVRKATSDTLSGFLAELKRMEPILRQLDGFAEGLAHSTLFKSFADAETLAHRLGDQVFDAYKNIFNKHFKSVKGVSRAKYWGQAMPKVAGIEVSKEASVAMALNTGNKENFTVLAHGIGKTKEEIQEFLESALTKADWTLVNDIWKHLDKDLWPILSKIYKEMTGLTLKKVKGNYYPIHSDVIYKAQQERLTDIMLGTDPKKVLEDVEQSFFRTRHGGAENVKLSLDALVKHLRDVVHTSTHWRAINNAQRLIKNTKFKNAVESTMGRDIYAQFDPWLSNLAKPFRVDPANAGLEKWLRRFRSGVTIGILGLVPKTAFKQALSFITALPKIGVLNAAASLTKFGTNPLRFMRDISEASPQMAYRIRTWQREIAEMAATLKPKDIGLRGSARNTFFVFIHAVDRMTASVTWHSAYLKGLDQFAGNANRSVEFADGIVRQTQPVSSAKDLPRVMRSGEFKRLVTMFYSYFSVWHNQAAEIIRRGLAGNMNKAKAISTLAFITAAPVVTWELSSLVGKSITGRDVEPDEIAGTMLKKVGAMAASGFPIGRDIAAGVLLGYDFKLSPTSELGREAVNVGKGLATIWDEDKEWDRRHTAAAVELTGYLLHMPSRQAVTTIQGALRLMEGDTDDPTELLIRASKQ